MIKTVSLLITATVLSISLHGQSQFKQTKDSDQVWVFKEESNQKINLFTPGIKERKDKGRNVVLNRSVLTQVWEQEPERFTTTLPLPHNKVETLTFVKAQVSTESCVISTSDGRKLTGKEYVGLHYRLDQTKEKRVGGISFREDGLMAVITHKGGTYNLGEMTAGKEDYVIVDDAELQYPGWSCGTEDGPAPDLKQVDQLSEDKAASCKTVKMFLEVDNDMYKKAGQNLTTATNMITGMFNVVSQMYQNEQITMQIGSIYVWTTVDPYAALTTSSTILTAYKNTRTLASIGTNNLTHLISTRGSFLGGIGYLNIMCSGFFRHAFSNIYYSYSALPTYSWSIHCLTHEIGHNLGSRHTHWCGWQLTSTTTGPIDRCYAPEANSGVSCGTSTASQVGTVMSYCHLNGSINLNLGFGTLPGQTIRTSLTNAACISGSSCLGTANLLVDSMMNKDKNYNLTITIPENHNATSWVLIEGTTTIQSASLTNQNAGSVVVPVSNKPNGSYAYSVVLTNSGGQTTSSSSLSVTVAVPAQLIGSSCIAEGLVCWIDAQGKLRFRFNISPVCTTYAVSLCRYNLTNPAVIPNGSETPAACGVRNGMSAYTPTAAERTQGFIERVASPQPSNLTGQLAGSYWYSCDVVCASSNCITTNRTRNYVFVAQP